jgi:hypothetical protein
MTSKPYIEAAAIPPTFVDELAAAVQIGTVTHLIFTAAQRDYPNTNLERVMYARLIVPNDKLTEIAKALAAGPEKATPLDDESKPAALH